ncbi:response regulator transcription factor [Tenacibaculum aiptasiae]|uniref:response regulator transcription factor n=1 Tax=Tenacibaculum aiptasiae TaxID=426481 RepID=UPI00232F69A9|nr:response regulator transcription factor [Tenacibaculum aiptasiae]
MSKIRIIIADDHTLFLEGLKNLLRTNNQFDVVDTVNNGIELLSVLERVKVDIVILDISMPEMDGLETCKILRNKYPNINVLILSTHNHMQLVTRLIKQEIRGYLLKNIVQEELFIALEEIYKGNTYFVKEIADKKTESERRIRVNKNNITELSKREKEILLLIVEEYTTQEIADKMFISVNTVNTHRRNLLSKLNVKNTAGLVKYAYENGEI